MGNRFTSQKQFKQLEFHSSINCKDLGQCEVYSLNKFPASYVIKIVSPLTDSKLLDLFSQVENQQNIYLLGLYGYRNGKLCHCSTQNVVSDSVISYWEYLSFSLKDAILQRKQIKSRFQQTQIWHIIKACIYGYEVFRKFKICFDFSSSRLFINQQGRIRFDWMHIKCKNQHSNFLQKLQVQDWQIKNHEFLSPEELQVLLLKQFTTKIDFQKANVFSLGMLLLQCMTLVDPILTFYSQNRINYPVIQQAMSSCSKYYSQKLLILVGSMLRIHPQERPLPYIIKQNYQQYFSPEFSIRTIKSSQFDKIGSPNLMSRKISLQ